MSYYDTHSREFVDGTRDVDMSSIYKQFLQFVPEGGSILDAGSGSGRDSLAFRKMGYECVAFDQSTEMVRETRERAQVPTYQMTLQTCGFDRRFDGIWACASLLHVPRDELVAALLSLVDALNRGGILYASFKHGAEERQTRGRYFNDMTPKLVEKFLLFVPDLIVEKMWITADQRPGRNSEQWVNCILRYKPAGE
jgi:SAM-dependent methyltransferase